MKINRKNLIVTSYRSKLAYRANKLAFKNITRNSNSSTEVLDSAIFTQRQQRAVVKAFTSDFNPAGFSHFVNAFLTIYKVNSTSAYLVDTCSRLIVLYVYMFVIHDDRFVRHINSKNTHIVIPTFILAILELIVYPVRSRTKMTGWVNGTLSAAFGQLHCAQFVHSALSDSKSREGLGYDENIDVNMLINEFENTVFSRVALDSTLRRQLRTLLLAELKHFDFDAIDSTVFDRILDFFETLDSIVLDYLTPMEMLSHKIDEFYQPHLSVYRFRNSHYDGEYFCNGAAISNVSIKVCGTFGSFLKIFEPVFNTSQLDKQWESLLPGDIVFSVAQSSLSEAWEFYLSMSRPQGKGPGLGTGAKEPSKTEKRIESKIDEHGSGIKTDPEGILISDVELMSIYLGLKEGYGEYLTSVCSRSRIVRFYVNNKTMRTEQFIAPLTTTQSYA